MSRTRRNPDRKSSFLQSPGGCEGEDASSRHNAVNREVSGLALECSGLLVGRWPFPRCLGSRLASGSTTIFPADYSWTLMLLCIGLLIGCLTAWRWIAREYREIRKEQEEEN